MGSRWKALPLSHTFYSAGGMDQAVCGGIEELTDYTLLSKGNKQGKVKRKTLSAPPLKGEGRMVEVKKRKVDGDTGEEVLPKKSKKKNTFNVIDAEEEMEEKSFLRLSRSQVVEESDGDKTSKKKKKKNRKSAKNKPAINLAALGGIKTAEQVQEKTEKNENRPECTNVEDSKQLKDEHFQCD